MNQLRTMNVLGMLNRKRNRKIPDDESIGQPQLDRISELPDHLLLKILSDMPLEDAIKTSSLSKRFHHLWTFIDCLRFECFRYDDSSLDRFVSFVDNVLLLSRSTNIKKVLIQVGYYEEYDRYYEEYEKKISIWLRWALWRNVEKVLLNFKPVMMDRDYPFYLPEPFYCLPQNICTSSSLKTLYISRCRFPESGVISWKFLRRLTMTCIVINDGVMEKVLLGCPVLERLELMSFSGFSNLRITNPNVKRLKLFHYWFPDGGHHADNVLKISAPYIQELEISGRLFDLQCRLVDVSSLVSAKINFKLSFCEEFDNGDYDICKKVGRDIVQRLTDVKDLTVGKWLLQVLSMLRTQHFSYSLSNCKCLTLNSYMINFEFPAVVSLLNSSPQLETLIINVDSFVDLLNKDNREPSFPESEKFLDSQNQVIKCLALHLKNLKIANYQSCCMIEEVRSRWVGSFDAEVLLYFDVDHNNPRLLVKKMFKWFISEQDICCKIAEFLLKNGKCLEKLVIISETEICETCSMCCAYDYQLLVAEKLLSVPKSSTDVVIKFVEKQHHDSAY